MPYKDPEDQKRWLKRRLKEGYGKELYKARKQHFENERVLRGAIEDALAEVNDVLTSDKPVAPLTQIESLRDILADGLASAPPVARKQKERA